MERSAENIPQSCGERVAASLRRIHPASTAKLVARDLGVSQRTVENWLLCVAKPSLEHFERMAHVYGSAFVVSVLPILINVAPLVEAVTAPALKARAASLRQRQGRARASLRGHP